MDKYIEIGAVYNTLTEYYHHTTEFQHLALREALSRIPAADVVPVVHGRWEQKEVFEAKGRVDELQSAFCPVCQRYHTTPYSYYFTHYNYCPNCGALMDKEGCGE